MRVVITTPNSGSTCKPTPALWRPVADEGAARHAVPGQGSPNMGIQAVVAVIAQHPKVAGWNRHLRLLVGHGCKGPGLPEGLAIALQVAPMDSHPIPSQTHDPA